MMDCEGIIDYTSQEESEDVKTTTFFVEALKVGDCKFVIHESLGRYSTEILEYEISVTVMESML